MGGGRQGQKATGSWEVESKCKGRGKTRSKRSGRRKVAQNSPPTKWEVGCCTRLRLPQSGRRDVAYKSASHEVGGGMLYPCVPPCIGKYPCHMCEMQYYLISPLHDLKQFEGIFLILRPENALLLLVHLSTGRYQFHHVKFWVRHPACDVLIYTVVSAKKGQRIFLEL